MQGSFSKGKEADSDVAEVQPRRTTNKNPYEENFKEIMRRENVMKQKQERLQNELSGLLDDDQSEGFLDKSLSHKSGAEIIPSNYEVALVTKAHIGLNPVAKEPAVRVYGFFKTKREAVTHLENLKRQGIDVSEFGDIRLAHRMKWMLIPTNKRKEDDLEYTLGKIENLRMIHKQERDRANRDFATNRAGKAPEKGPKAITLEKRAEKEAKNPKNKTTRQKAIKAQRALIDDKVEANPALEVATIPRTAELRGQNHIVIGIWKDYTEERMKLKIEPEPAVLLIDCFDQLEDAKKCVSKTLSKYINQLDLDIVDLYSWIYPEKTDPKKLSADQEAWRDEEQSLIMKQQKAGSEFQKEYEAEHLSEFGKPAVKHDVLAGDQKEQEIRPAETVMKVTKIEDLDVISQDLDEQPHEESGSGSGSGSGSRSSVWCT